MKQILHCSLYRILGCCLLGGVLAQPVQAQKPILKNETETGQPAKKTAPWQLRVEKDSTPLIRLEAKEAPLNEVVKDLSEQLGVPVRLSSVLEKQRVNAELEDASVETTMQALAPQVYLDELVNLHDASSRKLLAVYLSGINETAPARLASLKEQSETVLFVGNIDDEGQAGGEPKEKPLQVTFNQHLLSIRARRQPVALVLYEIAQQLGLSFELRNDGDQLVDLDIQDQPLEDVLRQLPGSMQLLRRTNLSKGASEPLKIILLAQNQN